MREHVLEKRGWSVCLIRERAKDRETENEIAQEQKRVG